MSQSALRKKRLLSVRIAGQGAMLFSGFALAQLCSLVRNATLGYALSKGDFGIAAALAVTLQLVETASDIGADRLLVQAEDGEHPDMLATAHVIMVGRGMATALALFLAAWPTAAFFRLGEHVALFQMLALVPLLRGFVNLEQRRRQRKLDNRAYLATEVGSQATALALLPFLLWLSASPGVIVWLSLAQSLAAVKLSHAMAEAPWRLALDRQRLRRFLAFGWPIWLSAFPLMIVYQADRVLVGRAYGMEALAAYSAAFMVTMVPGLVAAKVGHALMLPLLAEKRAEPRAFADRYRLMCETTVVMSAAYLVVFILIGGLMLPLAFGPNYRGLETVIAWLALMWAVRMIQAPAGMALMALGDNRPLLWAGLIRAAALPFAVAAAALSLGIEGIAAAGVIGEVASLGYVAIAAGGAAPGLARITIGRALALMPLGAAALLLSAQMPQAQLTVSGLAAATGAGLAVMLLAAAALPSLRRSVREWLGPRAVALTASVPSAPRP